MRNALCTSGMAHFKVLGNTKKMTHYCGLLHNAMQLFPRLPVTTKCNMSF